MLQDSTVVPIADYALIGDCRTAALVSLHGSIDWLCLPNFSSPSVFARILDGDAGACLLRPAGAFTASRRYLDGTGVLETSFITKTGSARIIDCLPILDGVSHIRPSREVLRVVEVLTGTISFEIAIDPKPDYARRQTRPKCRGNLGWSYFWQNRVLHIATDICLEAAQGILSARFSLDAGQRRTVSLSFSENEPAVIPPLGPHADRRLEETIAWWQNWSSRIVYEGPYRNAVVRSAVTLKLLSFSPSGAIVAAPTTSLPETLGGDRNWDYRYCWLRDAGLTMQALVGLGIREEATAFIDWMLHTTRLTWPRLQIMYDIYGRTDLDEQELRHLAGYRGSKPVRLGNGAYRQQQTDTYGEVIFAAQTYAANGGLIDKAAARMLTGLGKIVCETWREPDSGIWEIRGAPRQYTFSKVMCWTALDRLLSLHALGAIDLGGEVARYREDRNAIGTLIEQHGFNDRIQSYTGELDGDWVDSSLLLMGTVGYKDASDPRLQSTLDLIRRRLDRGGLLLRYEPGVDGLQGDEGTFGICSFWAVEQMARSGDVTQSVRSFEHLLSFGNDVGLFAEETDSKSGEALGNFPQAFSHVGLINVAIAIEAARLSRSGITP